MPLIKRGKKLNSVTAEQIFGDEHMQLTKQIHSNQDHIRNRIKKIRFLSYHISKQLETITDEATIKFKLRQCDELRRQRIALEKKLEDEKKHEELL